MDQWTTYFIERLSPLVTLAVIFGIATTGVILDKNLFQPFPFVVSCFTIFYIAFILRLKNDVDDYEKDCIAFPQRALPRGVLSKKDAILVLRYLEYGLIIYFAMLFIFSWGITRANTFITALYLWFLLHDFYAKQWLERRPLIKGLARHGLIIPITFLAISFGRPEYVFSAQGFSYVLLLFGAFYTFDICRKLDPYSHPVSLTYIHYYGFLITYWFTCGLLILSAIGAYGMGVHMWLWPLEICVCVTLIMLFKRPKMFRIAEMAGSLSFLAHAWAGLLQWL